MRIIQRVATLLSLTAVLLAGAVGTAHAATPRPDAGGAPQPATAAAAAPLAWECPAGDLCVWENQNGTGRRCNWSNADDDWWNTPVVCSWADDTKVESFANNGTSSRYSGVALYRGANYTNFYFCAPQGTGLGWNVPNGGVFLRSHRWITGAC